VRIAYLSGAYVPSREANSMHVMRMCQAMAKLGHEVTLHVRPGDIDAADDFAFYGVDPCFEIVKRARPQVRVWGAVVNAWRTLGAVAEGQRPDLIYAREFWALALVADLGVPFVFESHWKPKSPLHKAVEAAIMRHPGFRRVVLISDELRKIYAAEFPWLPAGKVLVAHDGADPAPEIPKRDRRKLGREGALQVGYVGSFWPGYGIDMVERLAHEMKDVDFHVIGGDPDQVAERRRRNAALANLTYHGFVAPSELPGYYASLDPLLAPYQDATPHIRWISPMKLFEYMAHGKAIVCSDFPVMREIIDHEKNGLLVRADDPAAWVVAIERLRDKSLRSSLSRGAQRKLEAEFTWRRRAERALAGQ
jgi:glycosyltransferase involved in cell wall biosynthesis